MTIANCKRCGRIFNRVSRDICPACVAEEDEAFEKVRAYLKEHRYATILETSEATDVDLDLIVDMIKSGRLIIRDLPNFTYACERCGAPIQVGRFCSRCTQELSSLLGMAEKGKENSRVQTDTPLSRRHGYYSR
ncbi:TIGR03826 family flagellar region protein [Alicyclobacillus kakegawensis]|uniref:TIGR03826 family flagellar region protein n=1 Tax=Alicyclobacillus kakegawensis TaxID=392012 RepID=UPI000833141C|nr:TIGR03826 family flagellar region protein [Alicyclobacillus kakegawensis]